MNVKKIFAIALTLGVFVGIVNAQSFDISMTWTPNPSTQMVTKYVIFQATGTSTNFVPVVTATGTNFAKVRVNSPNVYKFKVQAYNGVTNSALSDFAQVPVTGPTTPPAPEIISVEAK